MDCSSVTPKTCVLKVNLHGPGCEKKVHKLLRKTNGVSSIAINGDHGKVTVSGTFDPCTIIMALEKVGKKAELLWEDSAPINYPNRFMQASQSGEVEGLDPKQLQQLSKIQRVKQVEVINSKSVKLKFKDHEDELTQKSNTISINIDDVCPKRFPAGVSRHEEKSIDIDDVHGPKMHRAYGPHCITSSCHPCSHGHATERNKNYHFHGSAGPPRASGVHHENFNRCGPPQPPLASNYDHYAPCPLQSPSGSYSYPGLFSDDNPHGCRLM